MSDEELISDYARHKSEEAFATLVERHLNLVYSVARRHVRSAALAEEVAQCVFIDLARQAPRLKAGTPLVAWLHLVSRRTAVDVVRREVRRRQREQQAAQVAEADRSDSAAMKSHADDWPVIEPLLDQAVESLDASDRTAVLLRYFENKSLREVGAALGISDDTAQKRVSRAVEQLRTFFLRQGVPVTAAGLATNLSAHVLLTAPSALGGAIVTATSAAVAGGAIASGGVVVTAASSGQKIFAAAVLATVMGAGLWEASLYSTERSTLQIEEQSALNLRQELGRLNQANAGAERRLQETRDALARIPLASISATDPALEADIRAWLARIDGLKELARTRSDLAIPEMTLLAEQQWSDVARDVDLSAEESIRNAFGVLRQDAKRKFASRLQPALARFIAAHGGLLPGDPVELATQGEPPLDAASLGRYRMLRRGRAGAVAVGEWLLVEKSAVDPEREHPLFVSLIGSASSEVPPLQPDDLRASLRAFAAENSGQLPSEPAQLLPFLTNPEAGRSLLLLGPNEFNAAALGKLLQPAP